MSIRPLSLSEERNRVTEKEQDFEVKGSVHPKMTFQSLEASLRTV